MQVEGPLAALLPAAAVAKYQVVLRLLWDLAAAQGDLDAAARLHHAARRLPGCAPPPRPPRLCPCPAPPRPVSAHIDGTTGFTAPPALPRRAPPHVSHITGVAQRRVPLHVTSGTCPIFKAQLLTSVCAPPHVRGHAWLRPMQAVLQRRKRAFRCHFACLHQCTPLKIRCRMEQVTPRNCNSPVHIADMLRSSSPSLFSAFLMLLHIMKSRPSRPQGSGRPGGGGRGAVRHGARGGGAAPPPRSRGGGAGAAAAARRALCRPHRRAGAPPPCIPSVSYLRIDKYKANACMCTPAV